MARVVEVARHANADRLYLANVDDGHAISRVVFGGSRVVEPHDLVPYAPPGARLAAGGRVRRRRLRGEWSHGVLLSLVELGWLSDGPDEVPVLLGYLPGERLTPKIIGPS